MLTPSFAPFPGLTTPRLTLRKVAVSDVEELFFLRTDPGVLRYQDRRPAASREDVHAYIRQLHDLEDRAEAVTWALCRHAGPRLIGTISLWRFQKEHYRAEIGYVLHPGHQGQGLMREALTAVLDYGFQTLGLHSVEAQVNPANLASIRLLERAGFVREGYFRENYFFDGRFLDTAVYGLVRG